MSHYKPYPAYKDSGVEWIGPVPEHWGLAPLKVLARVVNGATPDSGAPAYWDGDIAWFTPADLDNEIAAELVEPRRRITADGLASCAARLTPAGSVVLSTRAPVGSVGVTRTPSATNQGCRTLVPVPGVPPKFLAETLVAARSELALRSNGTTFQELSTDSLASMRVPLPPLAEQSAIAAALNRETARIDALIAKKTSFIELLKEKRQALITHAVTKGLDPNVKMKDSGVEWIGPVPEHWSVCKLNFRYSVELGKMLDQKRITGEHLVPYLRNQDVQWGAISTDDLPLMDITPDEFDRYTAVDGDLLVCEGGDVGRAAIWRGAPIGYQKALHRLRPRGRDHATFMYNLLIAAKAWEVFSELDSKSTISHLPAEAFRKYRFPFPPAAEQSAIAAALNRETARIDTLIAKANTSITLLKERRSALITAAVTGQIDLRDGTSASLETPA